MKIKATTFLDYLILSTGAIFLIFFLQLYQGERISSFLILLSFVLFYIIWAFYHHTKDESLHIKTMIEYIFIGFTFLLLLIVIFII
ncbi:hypothetical protein A3F29_01000 [Candidatus Roizmanbacteria bacterium RIFCSPHIGHO2_12_FULL_33_9]|uniref:Uncharacterized protein n=1 Tax=Candidatus Roizmanbacteria bacterium RIFCSPHIGHO2_12_FULL_33_9 TaxID=1802045 RepID=A0A1F7HJA5_9BACT|nr:MAG: hypothetical protein A3F29_01000 [Candidatus Roizmanbacteria bacterium RIFCSPHIGHO2_12_FULL_33_9]